MAYSSWSVVFGEQPSAAKWNILGTNDAYFDSLIGSGTAWASWTPTFGNLSGGTLNSSDYSQIGKLVNLRLRYTLGGAGVAGSVTFSLPVNTSSDYTSADAINAQVIMIDQTDSAGRIGVCQWNSTSTFVIRASKADGTYTTSANLSSTVPFTWASTDTITVAASYEAA